MKRIVIIGGGVSGLGAAYTLKELQAENGDMEFVLLEKQDRLGGQVITEKINGFTVEGGPDCVIRDKTATYDFAKKIGIYEDLINTQTENQGTFILNDGKLEPLPEGVMMMVPTKFSPFVQSALLTWRGKLRAGMDLFIPRSKGLDDESLGSFVTRRFGREVLDKIAEPLVGGIHASDPETMSLKATFPRFLQYEKDKRSLIIAMLSAKRKMAKAAPSFSKGPERTLFVSFKNGMQELIDGLENGIGQEHLQMTSAVERVEPKTGGKAGYDVVLRNGERIEADAVIMTTLSYACADLIENFDKELSDSLLEIPCVSSATINLAYKREDVPHDLRGYGFLVPQVENRQIMASTWTSSKWPGRAPEGYVLLRTFAGGAFNQDLAFQDNERIVRVMRHELQDILGITAEPYFSRVFHWKASMPQYSMGHTDRVEKIEELTAGHGGLFITGASYRGVGVPDCLNNGKEAAIKALEFVKRK